MARLDRTVGELMALARNPSRDSRNLLFRHILTLLEDENGLSDGERNNLNAIVRQLLPNVDSWLKHEFLEHFDTETNTLARPSEAARAVSHGSAPQGPDAPAGETNILERAAQQLAFARARVHSARQAYPATDEMRDDVGDGDETVLLRVLLEEDEQAAPPRPIAGLTIDPARDRLTRDFDYTRAATDWTWETDQNGLLTHLSDGATAALHQPKVLLLGNLWDEIGRFADPQNDQRWQRCLHRRRPFDDIVLQTGIGGGTQSWILRGVPAFSPESGKFLGFRGTARIHLDTLLPAAAAAAAAPQFRAGPPPPTPSVSTTTGERRLAGLPREPAISERIYTLGHEFRTPLNAIMGFSELMAGAAMGPLDARYQNYASGIGTAAKRLLSVINDVLDKAQIEAGTVQLEPTLIRLDHLVEATVTEFLHSAPLRGCSLALNFRGPTAVVFADGEFLRLMLSKLLAESVHLTAEGSNITVHTRMHDARTVEIGIDGLRLPTDITTAFWLMTNRLRDDELSPETMTGAFRLVLLRQTVRLVDGDILLQGDAADANQPSQLLLRVPTFQGSAPNPLAETGRPGDPIE